MVKSPFSDASLAPADPILGLTEAYIAIDGVPAYRRKVQELLFGKDSELIAAGRVIFPANTSSHLRFVCANSPLMWCSPVQI